MGKSGVAGLIRGIGRLAKAGEKVDIDHAGLAGLTDACLDDQARLRMSAP